MTRLPILFVVFILLSGCTPGVRGFHQSDLSGKGGNEIKAMYFTRYSDLNDGLVKDYFSQYPEYETHVKSQCTAPSGLEADAALIPLIASTTQLLFDIYMDRKIKALENLKEASQGSYAVQSFIEADKLGKYRCVALLRTSTNEKKESKLGLLYVAKITPPEVDGATGVRKAFVLQPIFVAAENASVVAAERKDQKGNQLPPKINVSSALTLNAVGKTETGVPTLNMIGNGSVSVPNINVGSELGISLCKTESEKCPTSGLIPYPPADSGVIAITLGMSETGHVGIKIEQRKSELAAIKAALGPAIYKALEKELE